MIIHNQDAFTARPSCVLLDLDNTLYAYAPCHEAGMQAAQDVASRTLNISESDFLRCFADARTDIKNRLGKTASSHSRLLYFQRLIEFAGLSFQPMEALEMEQAYWRTFLMASTLHEEVIDFLDDLRIANIPVVIVTDLTAQIQLRKIVYWRLDQYIDALVTSEEVPEDKPLPAMFELALAKLGGVEGKVWMIGDNPIADIEGAKQAINAVTLLKQYDDAAMSLENCKPDAVFTSFGDVRKMLSALLAK